VPIKLQKVAAQLQVTLPTQPNTDQQSWLGEMSAASGPAFDQVWVDRLRAAHGKIFSSIATVRANTRNSLVRGLATAANDAVATHMSLLESTGLVVYNQLPTPAVPQAAANGKAAGQQAAGGGSLINPVSSSSGGMNPVIIWILLAVALVAGGATAMKVFQAK
jgi:hypothetical protein